MEDSFANLLEAAQSNVVQERAFTLTGGAAEGGANILDVVNNSQTEDLAGASQQVSFYVIDNFFVNFTLRNYQNFT